jgi:hypothetical protein
MPHFGPNLLRFRGGDGMRQQDAAPDRTAGGRLRYAVGAAMATALHASMRQTSPGVAAQPIGLSYLPLTVDTV